MSFNRHFEAPVQSSAPGEYFKEKVEAINQRHFFTVLKTEYFILELSPVELKNNVGNQIKVLQPSPFCNAVTTL